MKSIGWIDCRQLPRRVDLSAICGQAVAILTEIHPIDFFGVPTCECRTQKDSAGYRDTAALKFLSAKRLPSEPAMGFVVTDVNDRSWLIGSLEAPRPVVECTQLAGSPSGDSAGFQYEISHVALKSMIDCII